MNRARSLALPLWTAVACHRFPRGIHLAAILLASLFPHPAQAQGLRIDPTNPRYLNWRGRPILVVGSGEHYGAVLNPAFSFERYLATLHRDGLNHTRLFTGAAYVEPAGAFNIEKNTLAPRGDLYLAPWARSADPGYAGGGSRFDLDRWDETYFARLKSFVRTAANHRVFVEVNLFCPFYEESQWQLSPFHPDNNINGAGLHVARTNVYTLDHHGGLLTYQERFVHRVVAELEPFDNLYYEICNEPYFGGVTLEWQARIARIIAEAQWNHRRPKLISQNIANKTATVTHPIPQVSLHNFHYATPPDAVANNSHLNLPIGDNETGFRGTHNAPYRVEAWDFLMAGGALFSHLDYSFAAGHETGTYQYPASQPGGGNPTLRRQFRFLRSFLEALPFTRMKVEASAKVTRSSVPLSIRALTQPDRFVAAYIHTTEDKPDDDRKKLEAGAEIQLNVAPGEWRASWIDPVTGREISRQTTRTTGTELTLHPPPFATDLALKLARTRT